MQNSLNLFFAFSGTKMDSRSKKVINKLSSGLQIEKADIEQSSSSTRDKIIIFVITILFCTIFFSFHLNEQVYEKKLFNLFPGYIWTDQPVTAKFTFPVYKNDEVYKKEVETAKKNALQVFILEDRNLDLMEKVLDSSRMQINNLSQQQDKQNVKKKPNKKSNTQSFEIIENNRFKKISGLVRQFIDGVYAKGFISIPLDRLHNSEISVRLISHHIEKIYTKTELYDSSMFIESANKYFSNSLNSLEKEVAINIAKQLMQPNITYSQELSNRSKRIAEESVAKTEGIVREGEVIIAKGQQITDETIQKLKSYERSRLINSDTTQSLWSIIGSVGHATIIYSILIIYLFYIRKRIFHNNYQIAVLSTFLVVASFLSWLTLQIPATFSIEYFVLIPALSTLAAIIFDSRTAFYVTVTMSLMFAGIRGNDYDAGTAMLFAGTLAAYTVRDIQSRTQIFQSMFFIFIGFAVPIVFFGLERSAEFQQILIKLGAAFINSAVSPLITFGMLFLLERISNITTDLRLQEFNNLNHPLLLKLNEFAPGTYQHTLSVAILAEKCANAIGANQLLAKVGAYFHDIGKVAKPEYFVENQIDMQNKHDLLPPKKSASAIRNHVAEGVRLAKEYRLPQRIIDFIPMHHGTTLIKYFYAKALEEAEDKSTVVIDDFRYLGPKPRTRETAILMICDSAEALSRLAASDKQKLDKALSDLIHDRISDGQFDECDLNFKDLNTIKDTCIKNLTATTHARVEYKPIPKEEEPKPDANMVE